MAKRLLHCGLRPETLALLHQQFPAAEADFQALEPPQVATVGKLVPRADILLLGEELEAPVRLAQEAYGQDKYVSILLIAAPSSYEKIKQALQFSPFVGPTVQCNSSASGVRLLPIILDAMQRTGQRRSFDKLKGFSSLSPQFEPQVVAKVRADFSTKVLAEAPIGAVLLTQAGSILSVNQYAVDLFGQSEAAVLGATLPGLLTTPQHEEFERFLLDEYLSQPKRVFAVTGPAGLQHLEISVTRLDTPPSASYKLVILTNVTATVIAQQQTQTDLRVLRSLNADLDNFIYTASHDLKQPIANIEGLLLALQEELQHEQLQEGTLTATLLVHMQQAVDRFRKTIDDLTDISKLQQAHNQPSQAVIVAQVVHEVELDLAPQLLAARAHLTVEVPAHATSTAFSEKNLRSIIYNLLSNAVKYRDPARPVQIKLSYSSADGQAVLQVEDNGLGLDEWQQGKVFGLFKRLHAHVEGSGVGLYILKKIVENVGGTILVRSEVGVGSVFSVVFPT